MPHISHMANEILVLVSIYLSVIIKIEIACLRLILCIEQIYVNIFTSYLVSIKPIPLSLLQEAAQRNSKTSLR